MIDRVSVGAQLPNEVGEPREGVVERRKLGDLRADVHVDAVDRDARQSARASVDLARPRDWNAELVLGFSSGNLGVGASIDVRVDANGDARAAAAGSGDFGQGLEFWLRFDVEAADVLVEPERHLRAGLADAREDDLGARHAGGARARRSSPSETTSMPAPRRASVVSTA